MRYRIGAFQKLTGLTEGTLRYYEKMKLLRPARHDGNGYRYYDETDLLQLVQIRQFSGFDIPLGHLPREGEDVSCEQMYQQFSAQRNQLEQTIEELHNKLARIKLHEQNFGRIRTELGTVNRSSVGGIYRLFLSDPAVAAQDVRIRQNVIHGSGQPHQIIDGRRVWEPLVFIIILEGQNIGVKRSDRCFTGFHRRHGLVTDGEHSQANGGGKSLLGAAAEDINF